MNHSGRLQFVLAGLATLATALACACGDSKHVDVCALASCTSGASLQISLSPSVASMTQPKITVCRNAGCYVWSPAPLSPTKTGGSTETIAADAAITGTFWHNSDGSVSIDIEWTISDESQLVDGDRYVVALAEGAGAATTVLDKPATYLSNAAGGADCGPVCLQVTLKA
jgi:hypothetical protein